MFLSVGVPFEFDVMAPFNVPAGAGDAGGIMRELVQRLHPGCGSFRRRARRGLPRRVATRASEARTISAHRGDGAEDGTRSPGRHIRGAVA